MSVNEFDENYCTHLSHARRLGEFAELMIFVLLHSFDFQTFNYFTYVCVTCAMKVLEECICGGSFERANGA